MSNIADSFKPPPAGTIRMSSSFIRWRIHPRRGTENYIKRRLRYSPRVRLNIKSPGLNRRLPVRQARLDVEHPPDVSLQVGGAGLSHSQRRERRRHGPTTSDQGHPPHSNEIRTGHHPSLEGSGISGALIEAELEEVERKADEL
jgi:hypothetical protein